MNILLLEDDPEKREQIERFILKGEVTWVTSWAFYQRELHSEATFDLIIIDNQVPMLGGGRPVPMAYEALQEARRRGYTVPPTAEEAMTLLPTTSILVIG